MTRKPRRPPLLNTFPRVHEVDIEIPTSTQLRALYDEHFRKMEWAKAQCDAIIDAHGTNAHLEVEYGTTTLPYDAEILAERLIANDLIFAKFSAKYKFHRDRVMALGQRILIEQNDEMLRGIPRTFSPR